MTGPLCILMLLHTPLLLLLLMLGRHKTEYTYIYQKLFIDK